MSNLLCTTISIIFVPHIQIVDTVGNVDPASITLSSQPRGGEANVASLRGRNLQSLGLKFVCFILHFLSAAELIIDTGT